VGRFLINRIYIAILVAITVSIVGFSLLRLSGDLAAELAGEEATPAEVAQVAKAYGLDRPLYQQYFTWLNAALHGDLGRSVFNNEPVIDLMAKRVGVTVKLAFYALILALVVSIPLGVLAAVRQNTWIDRTALGVVVFGQAVPNFWFALQLSLIFGVMLKWLPIIGSDTERHFILPSIALSVAVMPQIMRLTRTGMLDVLDSDFIRTARAKGLSPARVLFKHALRNAILPVVSLTAVSLGFLIGGSVVIENIFGLNGIGRLAFDAILNRDFPVVQSILIMVSVTYIVLTLLSDLINAQLDPRISVG
jgi:peptide/nickel transport system permease protein